MTTYPYLKNKVFALEDALESANAENKALKQSLKKMEKELIKKRSLKENFEHENHLIKNYDMYPYIVLCIGFLSMLLQVWLITEIIK